ncbi:hypothetical protein ACLOJK_040490 [Asimina triloba]
MPIFRPDSDPHGPLHHIETEARIVARVTPSNVARATPPNVAEITSTTDVETEALVPGSPDCRGDNKKSPDHQIEDSRQLKDAIEEKIRDGQLVKYITTWARGESSALNPTHARPTNNFIPCLEGPSVADIDLYSLSKPSTPSTTASHKEAYL